MKLSEATKILLGACVPSARYDAKQIFEHIGGYSQLEMTVSDVCTEDSEVIDAVMRRAEREPLQYIIGKVYFYNEEYEVNENCLIPRSDTEILVDYAVKNIPHGARFLDLCTGSGCVGISVLKNTSCTTAILADISERALALCKRNAEHNGISEERYAAVCTNVLEEKIDGEVYAVLSNPPYIPEAEYLTLEKEIFHEPREAFVADREGLEFYERLTPTYRNSLLPGGFIAYEIGASQADPLIKIAEQNGMSCEILRDLSGHDRVAVLRIK